MDAELFIQLETSVKDKDLFYEFLSLAEIDIIKDDDRNSCDIFKDKLIEKNEKEFLKLLEKNELI